MEKHQVVATRAQSLKIWTSYGFGTYLLSYLSPLERVELQAVNQFSYNILVCRVMTKVLLPRQFFFSLWFCDDGPLDGKIIKLNADKTA